MRYIQRVNQKHSQSPKLIRPFIFSFQCPRTLMVLCICVNKYFYENNRSQVSPRRQNEYPVNCHFPLSTSFFYHPYQHCSTYPHFCHRSCVARSRSESFEHSFKVQTTPLEVVLFYTTRNNIPHASTTKRFCPNLHMPYIVEQSRHVISSHD